MFRLSFSGQPHWDFSALGQVWKVLADDASGLIAVECRNPLKKDAYLAILDPSDPNKKPEVKKLQTSKMLHIVDFWNNVILLQDFENENVPVSSGLTALAFPGFEELWRQPGKLLAGIGDKTLQLSEPGSVSGEIELINIFSGEPLPPNENFFNEEKITREGRLKNRQYPVLSMPNDAVNESLKKDLKAYKITLFESGPVCSLTKNGLKLFSYYRKNEGRNPDLEFAMMKNHKKVYSICIDENAEKLYSEPFFVFGEFIIAVKDKIQFMAMRVEE